jgi:5-methylcytosine-specific restriction endonuclease McrA
MPRNWEAARAKCEREQTCRNCGGAPVEAAHIVPRSRIGIGKGGEAEENICPLCRSCHTAYDQGKLDLLPVLTRSEQAYAVELVGLAEAYQRTTNERLGRAA